MSRLQVVVGGQYGSEAKGACTAFLARKAAQNGLTAVIRVAGPNAGHTAYDDRGRKWALRQIPVAAVVHPDIQLFIGAGSEIDFDVLLDEITQLEGDGHWIRGRLTVDAQATMIDARHKQFEAELVGAIGSTGKGIGAARAERLMRNADTVADHKAAFKEAGIEVIHHTSHIFHHYGRMDEATVLIEGTQGYGLGLHAGYYPQCTSSNCRAVDFLGMAGIDPNWFGDYEAWVVFRTYPIRVAGNSGPLKGETSWEELGFEPERTTVTQKIRRVGQWDTDLARAAVIANGGSGVVRISLSMADYVVPEAAGWTTEDFLDDTRTEHPQVASDLYDLVRQVERDAGAPVCLIGTGPQTFIELAES